MFRDVIKREGYASSLYSPMQGTSIGRNTSIPFSRSDILHVHESIAIDNLFLKKRKEKSLRPMLPADPDDTFGRDRNGPNSCCRSCFSITDRVFTEVADFYLKTAFSFIHVRLWFCSPSVCKCTRFTSFRDRAICTGLDLMINGR